MQARNRAHDIVEPVGVVGIRGLQREPPTRGVLSRPFAQLTVRVLHGANDGSHGQLVDLLHVVIGEHEHHAVSPGLIPWCARRPRSTLGSHARFLWATAYYPESVFLEAMMISLRLATLIPVVSVVILSACAPQSASSPQGA